MGLNRQIRLEDGQTVEEFGDLNAAVDTVSATAPLTSSGGNNPVIALAPVGQTRGDVLYFNGTAWTRLPAGNSNQFLATEGTTANPKWQVPPQSFVFQPGGTPGQNVYTSEAALKAAWDTVAGPKLLIVDTTSGAASLALPNWDFTGCTIGTNPPGAILTLTGAFTMVASQLNLVGALQLVQNCAAVPWTMGNGEVCNIDFGSSIVTNPGKAAFGNVPTGGASATAFLRDGSGIGGNGNAVFTSQGTSSFVAICALLSGVNDASALGGTGTNTVILASQSGVASINTTGGNVSLDPQQSNVNRIETTGVLGSNTTLFVNATPGLRYSLSNGNTGAFTTTLKATGDPGAGVTVAQTKSAICEINSSGACVRVTADV